ncbi:hypothetical protein Cadr_000002249 [Camelus dromedarius]|uniref:Uncharacterized protein n=1 Tax=Camelus dromedarius TaxID=9838 RepID=A0A5N4EI45_CAMDR|nr:hypothetical protein Cadr_000002249 [Camelus dromedarius]
MLDQSNNSNVLLCCLERRFDTELVRGAPLAGLGGRGVSEPAGPAGCLMEALGVARLLAVNLAAPLSAYCPGGVKCKPAMPSQLSSAQPSLAQPNSTHVDPAEQSSERFPRRRRLCCDSPSLAKLVASVASSHPRQASEFLLWDS